MRVRSSRPPLASGRYYRFPNAALTTALLVANRNLAIPFYVPAPCTLDRLGAEVTTIGATDAVVRLGIYADDGTFRPGALVIDAGTINGLSATVQEITLTAALGRGWHWFTACGQGSSTMATIRAIGAASGVYPEGLAYTDYGTTAPTAALAAFGFRDDAITGALPAAYTVDNLNALGPALFGRVA